MPNLCGNEINLTFRGPKLPVGVVEDFLEQVNDTFKKFEGGELTLEDQARYLEELQEEIADVASSACVLESVGNQEAVDNDDVSRDGRCITHRGHCEALACKLSFWLKQAYETLDKCEAVEVLSLIPDFTVGLV